MSTYPVVRYFPYALLVRVPLLANGVQLVVILDGMTTVGAQRVGALYLCVGLLQVFVVPFALLALYRAGGLRSWRHLAAIACGCAQLALTLEVLRRVAESVDR